MDLSRYPLEKAVYFVAGVIPGFAALLIFQLARPGVFTWYFRLGFLGYRTKLTLIVLVAFVIGNTMTAILSSWLGALGGAIGGWRSKDPYVPAHLHKIAPWRDGRWRIALANRLGAKAPKDTHLLSDDIWDRRRELVKYLPENDRAAALFKINDEKLQTEIDDSLWEQWYEHYHKIVISHRHRKWDLADYIRRGLNFNLETTSAYALLSAFWVRTLRQWWVLLPACMWVSILAASVYGEISEALNKWSSLSDQIAYLSNERTDS